MSERRTTMMAFLVEIANMLRDDGVTEDEWRNWAFAAWHAEEIVNRPACTHCGGSGRLQVGKYVLTCKAPAHNVTEPR